MANNLQINLSDCMNNLTFELIFLQNYLNTVLFILVGMPYKFVAYTNALNI